MAKLDLFQIPLYYLIIEYFLSVFHLADEIILISFSSLWYLICMVSMVINEDIVNVNVELERIMKFKNINDES